MALGFPGVREIQRKAIRGPINPMDKSTVVSIFPREIHETKHTIEPGTFHIEAGSYEKPSILVVGPSSWWKELEEDQPLLEIPVSSIQIADSIVKDYANGLLACNMGDSMPGLFFVPGEISQVELLTKHKTLLEKARANQKRWYAALVNLADSLWARSNGNPLTISDTMRLAALELGFKTKDWLQDFQNVEMVRCVACGSMRNPAYPICAVCKAVADPEKAKSLNIQFAQ